MPGAVDVAADLVAQGFDRGEFDFIAQAFQKRELDLCLDGQLDGMEVQNMGFDGERTGAECGRLPTLVTESKHSPESAIWVM